MLPALLAALLWSAPAGAQRADEAPVIVGKFGGINQYNDTTQVEDGDATDAQNVITDNGYIESRPGNIKIASILVGYPVTFLGQFVGASGVKYIISQSSTTLYASTLDGTNTVISTVTAGYAADMTVAYGKAIIVNGIDRPITFDETSSGTLAAMPVCSLVEFKDERLYCGNVATSGSQVSVSSFGGIAYWTIPFVMTADAPTSFTFNRDDGENMACMKASPWGLVIGKPHSMNVLKGYDNSTYYKIVLDPAIGCTDQRSMRMVDGYLVWLAADGGVYSWGGSGPPILISREVTPLVKKIRQLSSNSAYWIAKTQADWQAGSVTINGPTPSWDITSYPGMILPASNAYFTSSFGDWVSSSNISTNTLAPGMYGAASTTLAVGTMTVPNADTLAGWTLTGDSLSAEPNTMSCAPRFAPKNMAHAYTIAGGNACSGASGLSIKISILLNGVSVATATHNSPFSDGCSSHTIAIPPAVWIPNQAGAWSVKWEKTYSFSNFTATSQTGLPPGGFFNYADQLRSQGPAACDYYFAVGSSAAFTSPGTYTSPIFDTLFATPAAGPFTVSMTTVAGTSIAYAVGSSTLPTGPFKNYTAIVPGGTVPFQDRYWQYMSTYTTTVATQTPVEASVLMIAFSTGDYYSPVHFIGNKITSWKTIDFTDTQDPAWLLNFYVRSSTGSFSILSSTPAWTLQLNHQTITVSTGPYFQYRMEISSTTRSTQTASVGRSAVNWQEGTSVPLASGWIDHRYFLCGMFSTSTVINDRCLVLMQNHKWSTWSGPAPAAMTLFDNNLIVGSGNSDSSIWKIMQPGVYSDDGAAIDSYWVTKDFTWSNPYENKALTEIWTDAYQVAGGSMTVSYAANKSPTWTDRTVNLDGTANYITKRIPIPAGNPIGKFFRFKFASDRLDQYFRLNNFGIFTQIKPRMSDY